MDVSMHFQASGPPAPGALPTTAPMAAPAIASGPWAAREVRNFLSALSSFCKPSSQQGMGQAETAQLS